MKRHSETAYMVHDYPEPPEYEVDICACCGEEMGEQYEIDGEWICEDCFAEWIKDNYTVNELADLLSVSHK